MAARPLPSGNKEPLEPRFAFVLRLSAAPTEAAPSNSASPTAA